MNFTMLTHCLFDSKIHQALLPRNHHKRSVPLPYIDRYRVCYRCHAVTVPKTANAKLSMKTLQFIGCLAPCILFRVFFHIMLVGAPYIERERRQSTMSPGDTRRLWEMCARMREWFDELEYTNFIQATNCLVLYISAHVCLRWGTVRIVSCRQPTRRQFLQVTVWLIYSAQYTRPSRRERETIWDAGMIGMN